MVLETVQRAAILLVLAVVLVYVWHNAGRGRWRGRLTDRFVYGVPWGSLVSLVFVLLVYLFVQSGLESWSDPAVVPFRSWSYSYLQGMLAAGFTHSGPGHLISNVLAALVLAPLVEYAWGHYPPADREDDQTTSQESGPDPPSGTRGVRTTGRTADTGRGSGPEPPTAADRAAVTTGRTADTADDRVTPASDGHLAGTTDDRTGPRGLCARPLVRALVVFPAGLIVVSLLTSVFAAGFSLGYSGTVFFLLGAAVVLVPVATIVAMVALTGVNVVVSALQTPVLQATADPGAPGPPAWVGINVQAHLLGFLLGVLAAVALLRYRDRWPDVGHLALAVVLVVLSRNLWAFATSSGGVFTRWQALGVVFVLFLSAVIVAIVAVDNVQLAGSVTLRGVVVGGVVLITVLVALASVPLNLPGMADEPVPDTGGIEIRDYTVTYAENTPHGRVATNSSGVIVVSEQREAWSRAVRVDELRHRGEATATVGGVGWRETVDVERSGWAVAGNDTVYTVALEHGDQRVQPFRSDPASADARIAGHGLRVAAGPEFTVQITRDSEIVGETAIPPANESRTVELADAATVEQLTVRALERGGDARVLVEHGETRVLVAEEETYS